MTAALQAEFAAGMIPDRASLLTGALVVLGRRDLTVIANDTALPGKDIGEEEVIRDVLLAAQPTWRFVQPKQIGALAAFLCGSTASEITGTAIPIDGGWTANRTGKDR